MLPGGVEQAGGVVGGGGRIIWKLFPGLPASPPAGEAEEEVYYLVGGGGRMAGLPQWELLLTACQKEVLC